MLIGVSFPGLSDIVSRTVDPNRIELAREGLYQDERAWPMKEYE